MSLEAIRNERIKKIETLGRRGITSYPAESRRTHVIRDLIKKFSSLEKSKRKIFIAGRMVAKREHGGAVFIDLKDASGKIQAYFKKNMLGEIYDLFIETADIGDFFEIEGRCFKTKRGEETVEVTGWQILAKSLRPLPEKWHGLRDDEERFRKRYLDLLMNDGVRARFEMRSSLMKTIRMFLEKNSFLEVETPIFHPVPGGALAKPFVTHHNALDTDFYLRIAPELYLKRLLIGGFEKVYEIGKNFRNEGIDASHNPEFTELECYAAYWDEERMMSFTEDMMQFLVDTLGFGEEIEFDGKKISWKKPFPRVSFQDVLKRYALVSDFERDTEDSLAIRAKQLGIDVSPRESKGKIADEIYKKICRPYLVQPTFVVNHPLEISPLAKKCRENKDEVRRFQLVAAGMELTNAFAELNDPLDQRVRFEMQEKERGRDEEAHRMDEDYLEAMEYGMPPAAGLGVGIDRLVMLLTDTKNIREAVLFPTMRPH